MQLVTISSQRQITIPISMLEELGLAGKDKLLLTVEENQLVAKPKRGSMVARLAGSLNHLVPKSKLKVPTEKAIEKAMEIMAKEIVNE